MLTAVRLLGSLLVRYMPALLRNLKSVVLWLVLERVLAIHIPSLIRRFKVWLGLTQ
jgi:hypothetical protein